MADIDLALALALQQEEIELKREGVSGPASLRDSERDGSRPKARGPVDRQSPARVQGCSTSLIDASWELVDPNPDARVLFTQFNDLYFWGKLAGVELKWSTRMTLCAGLCCYEGRGGLCCIKLSEPLLKLRPRKDLVETLLHEMIHALLFVTQNNRDRDGHGPEFCGHMRRINSLTGANITVYHSFHDEVDSYRQHWWRCDGSCRSRHPYFGYVRRAMNRAPAPHDPWWWDHKRSCGGTFHKVREPDKGSNTDVSTQNGKKHGKDKREGGRSTPRSPMKGSTLADIRTFIPFFGEGHTLGSRSQRTASLDKTSSIQGGNVLENANDIQSLAASWKDSASARKQRDEPIVDITPMATITQHPIDKGGPDETISPSCGVTHSENAPAAKQGHASPWRGSCSNDPKKPSLLDSWLRQDNRTWRNKWSVSNTRVFWSSDGSPVKHGAFGPHKNRTGVKRNHENGKNDMKMPSPTLPPITGKEVECSGNLRLGSAAQTGAVLDSSEDVDFQGQKMKPASRIVNETLPVKRPWSPVSVSGDERSSQAAEPGKRARSSESSTRPGTAETRSEEGATLLQVGVTVRCPACRHPVPESRINEHLDACLQ
uniref:DNA-dependent metalloprotease SPRTN n=1 Tax=Myxine glutinosa TaxID=7769 RepID=UPI00358DDD78